MSQPADDVTADLHALWTATFGEPPIFRRVEPRLLVEILCDLAPDLATAACVRAVAM